MNERIANALEEAREVSDEGIIISEQLSSKSREILINPGKIFKESLPGWYRQLFYPMIQAGILRSTDLVGYRRNQVYIKDALHITPPYEYVIDAMDTLFDLLQKEESGAVRALLGHYFFVYIHPYMDGNGRLVRFLMNLMLVTAGYPWTIIRVTERAGYMKSLDLVAREKDIKPFTGFIIQEMMINH